MKKVFFSTAAVLLLGNASLAADLVSAGPATLVPPVIDSESFDWSGFYVGVHAGLLSGNASTELDSVGGFLLEADVENGTLPSEVTGGVGTGLFGVQAGYNAQFGSFVLGVEGDVAWAGSEASAEYSAIDPGLIVPAFAGEETVTSFRTEMSGLATFRLKAGVAADRALFYVTGGVAVGHVDNSFQIGLPGLDGGPLGLGAGPVGFGPWSDSGLLWGYAAGLGVEYAVTDNVTAKLEYLHYDLADRTIDGSDSRIDGMFGPQTIGYNFFNNGNLVRAGLNFKF